jgi:uncharacterized membrane protein
MKGYVNLGDCIVLVAGWILSPWYAFLAAGLGSALADLFSGYVIYAPATFLIKGGMALVALFLFRVLKRATGNFAARLVGAVCAELLMVLGYFVFEGFLYGFAPSLVNIPANAMQGVAGVVIGCILIKVLEKTKLVSGQE